MNQTDTPMTEPSNNDSLEYVYNLKNAMRTHNFILAYKGIFSHEITKALLASTGKRMRIEGTEGSVQKKVFYVMVECLQNICKSNSMETNPAIFMIGGDSSHYVINAGNVILNEKTEGLRNKLIAINSMNKEELKELYKSLLTTNEFSDSGGVGIGLIDIAKKSGNKLDFSFEKINDRCTFFALKTTISLKDGKHPDEIFFMQETIPPQKDEPVSRIHEFYNLMVQNNLALIYEGIFNQEITKMVLALSEKNFNAEELEVSTRKKIFNVMVESLQNICKHQYPDTNNEHLAHSIFMIGNDPEKNTRIISGNALSTDVIPSIKARLNQINSLGKEGLKQLYKEVRLNTGISDVGGAGLGFIDMARKSGNKLRYQFNALNESLSFFILQASVANKEAE